MHAVTLPAIPENCRHAFQMALGIIRGGREFVPRNHHWMTCLMRLIVLSRKRGLDDGEFAEFKRLVEANAADIFPDLTAWPDADRGKYERGWNVRFVECIADTLAEHGAEHAASLATSAIFMMEKIDNPVEAPQSESSREVNMFQVDIVKSFRERFAKCSTDLDRRLFDYVWERLKHDKGSIVNRLYSSSRVL